MIGIVEIDRRIRNIEQFDVLIDRVISRPADVRRMIHDFVDDDRSHLRVGIAQAGPGAELLDCGRIVHPKGARAQGRKLRPQAGVKPAKGDAILPAPKLAVAR